VNRFDFRLPTRASAPLAAVGAAVLVLLNLAFHFSQLNFWLIAGICIALVLWLKEASLPRRLLLPLEALSGCVLEIYFLHSYLVVKPTGFTVPDAAISLACILLISLVLHRIAETIRRFATGRIVGAMDGVMDSEKGNSPR
jgi:hypothetical protein